MQLTQMVTKLNALAKNLQSSNTVRERVRISDRIFDTLSQIEKEVEQFVVTEIGHTNGSKPPAERPVGGSNGVEDGKQIRFENVTIAEGAKMLLKEHGVLHGTDIERLLKAGGYESKAKKFQNTMVVAFDRNQGFQNIGKNRWKLKE